jgi:hypothetical protein
LTPDSQTSLLTGQLPVTCKPRHLRFRIDSSHNHHGS